MTFIPIIVIFAYKIFPSPPNNPNKYTLLTKDMFCMGKNNPSENAVQDTGAGNIIVCILKLVFLGLPLLLISLVFGLISSIFAMIYLNFSIVYNILIFPITRFKDFIGILSSHGELLTIIFCLSVIAASGESLDAKTTGIMSFILLGIIIYKVISAFKSK